MGYRHGDFRGPVLDLTVLQVVALVMGGILVTAHPFVGIAIGVIIAALVIIAIHERWRGRPF
jgi:hypothetical protein